MSSGRPVEFHCGGETYDLSHTFPKIITAKTKGRPGGTPIKIILSCHCFTLKVIADSGEKPDYQFEDEVRWFCPERFEYSKSIHGHFEYALKHASSFNVFWTSDNSGNINYLTVDLPEEGFRYCIYFDIGASKKDSSCEVIINIRSAYKKRIKIKNRDRVRLGALVDQVLGIKKPGKRRKRRKK